MPSKKDILDGFTMLSKLSSENGFTQLAADAEDLIARHSGEDVPAPENVTAANNAVRPLLDADNDQADEMEHDSFDHDLDESWDTVFDDTAPESSHIDVDDDFDFDQETMLAAGVTLRVESANIVNEEIARTIIDTVLPSITAVCGELVVESVDVVEQTAFVRLVPSEDRMDASMVVDAVGAFPGGFEADIPVGPVNYRVSMVADQPHDEDDAVDADAEDYGRSEVPEGQHPINGILGFYADEFGNAPVAAAVRVTYRKEDGPLTVDQTQEIVNHPISQAGLQRMGDLILGGIDINEDDGSAVATFGVLESGEINPATLTFGATSYRGTVRFGGDIGVVTASAEAVLADTDEF